MILSQLVADADLRAKYSDEHYEEEVEELFREKFSNNLQMFEDIIQQWQDNSLKLADYGLDFIPAPLQMISKMANGVWLVGRTLYTTIVDWFRGRPADLGW